MSREKDPTLVIATKNLKKQKFPKKLGKKTVDEALKTAQEEIQRIMDENIEAEKTGK